LSFIILFALANIVLAILVYNSFGWYTVLTPFLAALLCCFFSSLSRS
jgi:uncharacterized membrane-anchored protein YitT (DUF2179 family)